VFLVYLRRVLSGLGHSPLSRHAQLLIVVTSIVYALGLIFVITAIVMGLESPLTVSADGEEFIRPEGVAMLLGVATPLLVVGVWNFVFLVRTYRAIGQQLKGTAT
jgi:hypothetical protein